MTPNQRPEIPMNKLLTASALALVSGLAPAHVGHSFAHPHWHASELFGLALMLGCAAAAFWLWRKKQ